MEDGTTSWILEGQTYTSLRMVLCDIILHLHQVCCAKSCGRVLALVILNMQTKSWLHSYSHTVVSSMSVSVCVLF